MSKANIGKLILSIFLLLITGGVVSATDWNLGNPRGLGYTNVITDQFTITNNNASTGYGDTIDFINDGSYSRTDIFQNCNNCLYTMINPSDNTRWGTDEAGNVFYTSSITPIDYSLGFYSCCDAFGNPTNSNNLHRVATLSAVTSGRKITFDSSGNVYVNDIFVIKRLVKSTGYSTQTFFTLTDGVSYKSASGGGPSVDSVEGLIADSNDNIHVLSVSQNVGGAATGYVTKAVISQSGTLLYANLSLQIETGGIGRGFSGGGMVLDAVNPFYNFTYSAVSLNTGAVKIWHNSTAGTVDVGGGALVGITSAGDIGYNNFQIYITSPADNLVRSYVTNFEGFGYSQIPTNPDSITGTFSWLNGYGSSVTTITPGAALAYRWTISNELSNYTFFSGWSTNTQTEPGSLHDLTDLSGLGKPAVFPTSSNDLAGTSIYGYLLARRNNDSQWSMLTNPQILTISPAAIGYDSITLDKNFYNLTGDTISATFTYSSSGAFSPYIYKWQVCSRADCADGQFFNQISLIGNPSTSSMSTDGMQTGNYYAVMMRHLPVLSGLTNEIVASQRFEVRPPVIGVSWDKLSYNLFPKSSHSSCLDSVPGTSYFQNISGYAGLQLGAFSCSSTPADANANNSIMRGSIYARYNGSFYLNNSLGQIWNGTLNNGSGLVLYVLTNTSATETWTLTGVNNTVGETFYANAEVVPESSISYTISVSPSVAYNQDTLSLTFTRPIWRITDYVIMKDAGGTTIATFPASATSGRYFIDPSKQYVYGTWTAYWSFGSIDPIENKNAVFTFTVKNAGRPQQNGSIVPAGGVPTGGSAVSNLGDNLISFIAMPAFWGLIIWVLIIYAVVSSKAPGRNDPTIIVAFLAANIEAAIGLWSPYTLYILALTWLIAAVMFLGSGIGKQTTTGDK